ncbi:MAG: prohibitin family protein [Armatimonadota bacterium]
MGAVFGFLLAAGVVIWGIATSVERTKGGDEHPLKRVEVVHPLRLAGAVLVGIALWVMGGRATVTVPGGHVACVYDPARGGIQEYTLPEGLSFIAPWSVPEIFSVRTQEYTMSIAPAEGAVIGDDSIKCETNEGLKVLLDLTVLFHIDPQHAPMLWRKLGSDYSQIFVRPIVRERIRMVVAKYSVADVYSGRRQQIANEITSELQQVFSDEGLVLEQILLRNVTYGYQDFANVIAEKQSRQQQVITEKRNLERAKYEKQSTVNEAQGEAKSIALRAQTLSSNPQVVNYELVRKLAPRISKAYMSQSSLPFPSGGSQ